MSAFVHLPAIDAPAAMAYPAMRQQVVRDVAGRPVTDTRVVVRYMSGTTAVRVAAAFDWLPRPPGSISRVVTPLQVGW